MAQKQTLQQFGQSIKAKHPEYKDMDDAALGKSVLGKYPQYSDLVEQETPKIGGSLKAGDSTPLYSNLGEDKLTRIEHGYPGEGIGHQAARFVGNIGAGGLGVALHPIDTLKSIGSTIAHPDQAAHSLYDSLNTQPGETIAPMIGQTAVTGGLGEGAPALKPVGEAMQRGGEGVLNRTIGAVKSDFNHGANPARGYLKGGGGPALTMGGLADKAETVASNAGAKLGDAYKSATQSGMRIPVAQVSDELEKPLSKYETEQEGPGATGASPLIGEYRARLQPQPNPAAIGSGGYTPSGVFNLKRSIANQARWNQNEPIGLNDVRQEQVGRLGGMLADQLPEIKPQNDIYQGATKLANRAAYRSETGVSPLSQIARRGIEAGLGAGIGVATHNPLLGAVPMALDSVPVRTSLAAGLYHGGGALPSIAATGARLSGPAAAIGGIKNKKPDEEPDEK
jgi:hypothetical protein